MAPLTHLILEPYDTRSGYPLRQSFKMRSWLVLVFPQVEQKKAWRIDILVERPVDTTPASSPFTPKVFIWLLVLALWKFERRQYLTLELGDQLIKRLVPLFGIHVGNNARHQMFDFFQFSRPIFFVHNSTSFTDAPHSLRYSFNGMVLQQLNDVCVAPGLCQFQRRLSISGGLIR